MNLKIIKAGVLATLQDAGRTGWRRYGIARGGAMDEFALRVANIIIGNDEREAAIEITLGGFVARFESDALIALGGGEFEAMINDCVCQAWRPVFVEKGSTLEARKCVTGARVVLAVAGGFRLETILGSCSAMRHADLDWLPARALRGDDELVLREMNRLNKRLLQTLESNPKLISDEAEPKMISPSSHIASTWRVSDKILPRYSNSAVLRVVRGREFELLNEASRTAFFDAGFDVTKETDRTGSRLRGAAINLTEPYEMISEAVTNGTLQVTPNGELIALQAEHHTTGGYPRAAHVITVDLPLLGQLKAGDTVRFRETTIEQSHELFMARERAIAQLKHRVSLI